MSREFSLFTKLDPCELGAVSAHVQYIKEANSAISAIQFLLDEFNVSDVCEDEIPDKIKSNYVRGGLLQAINCLTHQVAENAEWLERQIEVAEKNNAKNRT